MAGFSCAKHDERFDYNEAQVKEFVKPGITRAELSARFGAALSETEDPDGTTVLLYRRGQVYKSAKELLADKGGFTGFQVRENKVVRWDAITSGPTR